MKLSEYAKDLLAMVELYGDHNVVEYRESMVGMVRHVRAPRLCNVVRTSAGIEHAVQSSSPTKVAEFIGSKATGEVVYRI